MIAIRQYLFAPVIILAATLFGEPGGPQISNCSAGDWPQLLGPNRDSQAIDEKPLNVDWSGQPPKILWRLPIGSGYAGAAIVNEVAYLCDRMGQQERLTAVDLRTGKSRWMATWPASYRSAMDPDSGPRAVPVIASSKAICYGAAGDLVCIDVTNGQVQWNQGLRKQYGADDGYFGAGCSPIVIGNVVIVNIGGKNAGIVGLSLETGKLLWKATNYDASYASPIAVDVGGQPAALVVTRLKTVLLSAQSGELLSEVDFGSRGPTVNAATPLRLGSSAFLLTASYSIGTKFLQLDGSDLRVSYADKELLASQYNSPVKIKNAICGVHGREDGGEPTLRLIDVDSHAKLSETPLPGTTHLIAVGNQLLMLSIDGTLQLASLVDQQLQVHSKYTISEASPAVFRALPALSNHVLLVRTSQDGQGGHFTAVQLP